MFYRIYNIFFSKYVNHWGWMKGTCFESQIPVISEIPTHYSERVGLVFIDRLWKTERKQKQKRHMFIRFVISTHVTDNYLLMLPSLPLDWSYKHAANVV